MGSLRFAYNTPIIFGTSPAFMKLTYAVVLSFTPGFHCTSTIEGFTFRPTRRSMTVLDTQLEE